jgi:hypothetical protein
MNSTWNKEDLPEQGMNSINIRVYKTADKTDCSTYKDVSLLSNTYRNFIQHPAVKIISICRGNYLVSSLCIST